MKIFQHIDAGGFKFKSKRIELDLFLSFLEVPVIHLKTGRRNEHHNRHFVLINEKNGLHIGGLRVFSYGEAPSTFLDSIQYEKARSSPWNCYTNPFGIFDLMTNEGKEFFAEYYEPEIKAFFVEQNKKIQVLESEIGQHKEVKDKIKSFNARYLKNI